jgi:hypothetical protein
MKKLMIVPFVRNKNSGSRELTESLVMTEPLANGLGEDMFDDNAIISSMAYRVYELMQTKNLF